MSLPNKKRLPARTAERFFLYSRFLKAKLDLGAENVFSHELSLAVGISPEQVRQDLMLLSIRGTPQRGYAIKPFLDDLNVFLGMGSPAKAVIAGTGEWIRPLLPYFSSIRPNLIISAAFYAGTPKPWEKISGCPVYHLSMLEEIIRRENPLIGIISVPPESSQQLADDMAALGIKGILNFSQAMIKLPQGVFVEQLDISMALEKTVFFARDYR